MTFDPIQAALIVLAVVFFVPTFLLGLHKPTSLGYLAISLNLVSFPFIWFTGAGIFLWITALVLAALARGIRHANEDACSH